MTKNADRYSIEVLMDCIELQSKKGQDYQSKSSSVKQADYYRLGLDTIYDIMWAKMLRIKSQLEAARNNPEHVTNFESIGDSAKDLINYCSFFVSYAEGKMDGQNPDNDIFNRPKIEKYNPVDSEKLSKYPTGDFPTKDFSEAIKTQDFINSLKNSNNDLTIFDYIKEITDKPDE